MSFQPFVFKYTPPPTLAITIPSVSTSTPNNSSSVLAQATIKSLNNLIDTNTYLQALIVAKYNNAGVSIDPNSDPVTANALAACYNGVIPPIVTTGMYNNLLDCQLALQNINQAVGPNSNIQADPLMVLNVTQIINAVAEQLTTQGTSDQLAIQSLALLKSDNVVMSNIVSGLAIYQSGTDLSPSVSSNINTLINNEASLLNSVYSLQTQANVIDADTNNVLNAYVSQPLEDVVRITAAIQLMYNMNYQQEASKVFNGISSTAGAALLSSVSGYYFKADQLAQRILTPLKSMTGALGSTLNTVNKSIQSVETASNLTKTTASNLSQPGLKGFSNCNPCSQKVLGGISGSKLPTVPGFNGLSPGLQFLGQTISAAQSSISSIFTDMESSFIALQKRRNKDFSDVLQIMCAMQSAESLISIGKQVGSSLGNSANPTSVASSVVVPSATSTTTATTTANSTGTTSTNTTSNIPVMPTNVASVLSPSLPYQPEQ